MRFYEQHPADPDWLAEAAQFHGHLGPWLTLGVMVGRDALARLETSGHWLIQVVCLLPPDKQRTPYTCLLDGLQVGCGATLGKCNLRLGWAPQRFGTDWPVVCVARPARDSRDGAGVLYRLKAEPLGALRNPASDQVEELARRLAGRAISELFEVRDWPPSDWPTA